MNIDELAEEIKQISGDKTIQELSEYLVSWKNDDSTAEELKGRIERFIGNRWIESGEDHSNAYKLWSSFRDEAIVGIGGMTMNERLYWFALFDRYESSSDQEKMLIYKKLHATP